MIVKVLALAALVKLAAAYSVAIPRITKDLDGTKIDIDVQVDIDTGEYGQAEAPAPAPAPTGPGGRVTKPEFEISTVTQDLCNLDGEGLNGCKNGGVCYSELDESGVPLYKCRCVGPWTGPVCDVPVEGSTPPPTIIDTTTSPSPLSTYPDYDSSSSPPEICATQGFMCNPGLWSKCCDGLVCSTQTRPSLCVPATTTTPEICMAGGSICRPGHGRPCCDGLACSVGIRPSRCMPECKKEKESFLGSYPGDCTKCCSKKCELAGLGFLEKLVTCKPKNYTRPTPTFATSPPFVTEVPNRVPNTCNSAGQACEPGTERQESSLKCCPNHLCDLDHKICRRVAYRQN